jgi:CheY-like chemotaxis protein
MNKILSIWNGLFGKIVKSSQTILVIDDSPVDRKLYVGILEKRLNVIEATSGRDGLSLAKERQPNVILLDYELPDLKGPEVCRLMKLEPLTKDIPIIMLTAYDMPAKVIDSFDCGVDMYLSKPVRSGELFKQVEQALVAPAAHQ